MSFLHVSGSKHSQQPAISFSWQHFLIRQNGGLPPLPASPFTPELHHATEQVIALLVLLKRFTHGGGFEMASGFFFVLCPPKFLAEIPGEVLDLPRVP